MLVEIDWTAAANSAPRKSRNTGTGNRTGKFRERKKYHIFILRIRDEGRNGRERENSDEEEGSWNRRGEEEGFGRVKNRVNIWN